MAVSLRLKPVHKLVLVVGALALLGAAGTAAAATMLESPTLSHDLFAPGIEAAGPNPPPPPTHHSGCHWGGGTSTGMWH